MEDGKYFCINCFEDENIRNFIKSNGKHIKNEVFKCKFCQVPDGEHNENYEIKDYDKKLLTEEIYVIKQDLLNEKIIEIINEHFEFIQSPIYNGENGLLNLIDILSDKLFYGEMSDVLIKLAKYDFIKYKDFPFNESEKKEYTNKSKNDYTSQEIYWINCWKQKENISWNEFKEHTKYNARYFDHKKSTFNLTQTLEPFNKIYKSLQRNLEIKKVYRARIITRKKLNQEIEEVLAKKSKKSEENILSDLLGKAPKEAAKNNRFSPIGISYGYFSFDEKTAIYEVRAELTKELAIGTFEIEEKLSLVDFRKLYSLSSELYEKNLNPFDKENFNILITDIYEFIKDISKPINENDTLLEYVPTQIMAEYILSLDYDGFIFDSSQNKDGENLVLFGDNPNYLSHKFIKITEKNINYTYKEI